MPDEANLKEWIDVALASEISPVEADLQFDLSRLEDAELGSLINDLNDVYRDTAKVVSLFDALVSRPGPPSDLEDVLVEVEIRLAHALHHWQRGRDLMRSKDLWNDEDFFEERDG